MDYSNPWSINNTYIRPLLAAKDHDIRKASIASHIYYLSMLFMNLRDVLALPLTTSRNTQSDWATADQFERRDILFKHILRSLKFSNIGLTGTGVLDVLPVKQKFGFLRLLEFKYMPGPFDIYVSPTQIEKFCLQTGDIISGEIRLPKDHEQFLALIKITNINDTFLGNAASTKAPQETSPIRMQPTLPN